jgi:hypothetical protein
MSAGESPRKRVLMIAGAQFTDSVVFRHTAHLKKATENYSFDGFAFDTGRTRPGHAPITEIFDRHEPYPGTQGKFPLFPGLFRVIPDALATTLASNPELPDVWRERFGERTIGWRYASVRRALAGYDLYHWHCFEPWRLHFVRLLPPDAKLIVTLWGSDLFRTAGIQAYARQLFVAGRASAFTMASPEMREVFLSKFGRHLESKVHIMNYGACNLLLVRDTQQGRSAFLAKMGLPDDKVVICVGNNGVPENRHLDVVKAIAALPPDILARIALIAPLTYGSTPQYVAEVRSAIAALAVPARILDTYLDTADIAALRGACDITVHVPLSDQLSAAMCEALYAGSVLIAGAWLPYSLLRRNRVYYHTVEAIPELTERLPALIAGIGEERRRTFEAAAVLYNLSAWDCVVPRWLSLYDEVCGQGGRINQ